MSFFESVEIAKMFVDVYRWSRKFHRPNHAEINESVEKINALINPRHGAEDPRDLILMEGIRNSVPRVKPVFPHDHLPSYAYPEVKLPQAEMRQKEVHEKALVEDLRSNLPLNEEHAIFVGSDLFNGVNLSCEICDFAYIKAMRTLYKESADLQERKRGNPEILSAGAVLVCAKERKILVHKRSPRSATYPDRLHILAGAYKPLVPRGNFDSPGDRESLEYTMIREVFEESSIIVRRYPIKEPVCVARELDTGFVQFVYLGVRVTASDYEKAEANSEGQVVSIAFNDLEEMLRQPENWVPTGRAHILMWLALGAPGAGFFAKFGGKSAKALFEELTKK